MNRGKWFRLICFFAVFALIMLFPLYKFYLFEYTHGTEIALPVSVVSEKDGKDFRFRFRFPNYVPAEKNSPQLAHAYACFAIRGDDVAIDKIVLSKKEIPAGVPYVKVQNLFVQATWNDDGIPGAPYYYEVRLPFNTYSASDGSEAEALRENLKKNPAGAKLVVSLYADGEYRVKGLRFD